MIEILNILKCQIKWVFKLYSPLMIVNQRKPNWDGLIVFSNTTAGALNERKRLMSVALHPCAPASTMGQRQGQEQDVLDKEHKGSTSSFVGYY